MSGVGLVLTFITTLLSSVEAAPSLYEIVLFQKPENIVETLSKNCGYWQSFTF